MGRKPKTEEQKNLDKIERQKNRRDINTKIVTTKVQKDVYPILERIAKERFSCSTTYEFLQLIISVCLSLDREKQELSEDRADIINKALEPFLEIEDKQNFIRSFEVASGKKGARLKGKGEISTVVIIRNGGLMEVIEKDSSGHLEKSFSHDRAVLLTLTSGRKSFQDLVNVVMRGNKCGSIVECIRLLLKEAVEDAEIAIKNEYDTLGYSSIEYGQVPKQIRNMNEESNFVGSKEHYSNNAGSIESEDYYSDFLLSDDYNDETFEDN